jgi:general secretion pathway protein F
MPRFYYRALTVSGELVSGEIDGADSASIIARLNAEALLPIDAVEQGLRPRVGLSLRLAGRHALRARDLALLSQQLARLLRAGLPLDRALEIEASLAADQRCAAAVRQTLARVRDGAGLAEAMAAEQRSFPEAYVSMVRAGEEGAALPAVLSRLGEFLARAEANRQRVVSALIYPAILAAAALSVTLVLTVVLPQFEPFFAEAGARLPASARLLMAIGSWLGAFWWAVPLTLGVVALGLRQALLLPRVATARDRLVLRLPLIGLLVRRFEIGRFARTLGALLANGVAAPRALALSGAAIGNKIIAGAVETVATRFIEGEGLSAPLARSGEFPALAIQLIRTGEETGRLDEMLNEIAETFEEEAERTVERLIALLVPVITIAMGMVIAAIIATVMSAMISINDLAV